MGNLRAWLEARLRFFLSPTPFRRGQIVLGRPLPDVALTPGGPTATIEHS
jgi:hypothetical protein